MSEIIDKRSLLIWLAARDCIGEIVAIESGRFDVHIGEGISVETLEKIGKRVAEIRAETAEKERDELRKEIEIKDEALRRIQSNCVGWKRPSDLTASIELIFKIADSSLTISKEDIENE